MKEETIEFRKINKLVTKLRGSYLGGTMHARRWTDGNWERCYVHYLGATVYSPKSEKGYKRWEDFVKWAKKEIERLVSSLGEMYVVWDTREFLFLVSEPYWNAGTWTRDIDKATKYSKKEAENCLKGWEHIEVKTVSQAKAEWAKATPVARIII